MVQLNQNHCLKMSLAVNFNFHGCKYIRINLIGRFVYGINKKKKTIGILFKISSNEVKLDSHSSANATEEPSGSIVFLQNAIKVVYFLQWKS